MPYLMMFLSCWEPLIGPCGFFYSAMMLIVVFDSCNISKWAIVHLSMLLKTKTKTTPMLSKLEYRTHLITPMSTGKSGPKYRTWLHWCLIINCHVGTTLIAVLWFPCTASVTSTRSVGSLIQNWNMCSWPILLHSFSSSHRKGQF